MDTAPSGMKSTVQPNTSHWGRSISSCVCMCVCVCLCLSLCTCVCMYGTVVCVCVGGGGGAGEGLRNDFMQFCFVNFRQNVFFLLMIHTFSFRLANLFIAFYVSLRERCFLTLATIPVLLGQCLV